MLDVAIAVRKKIECLRFVIDDGHHLSAERSLELSLVHKVSQDGIRLTIVLKVNADTEAFFVAFIADF